MANGMQRHTCSYTGSAQDAGALLLHGGFLLL
jgi:hypothetical protein